LIEQIRGLARHAAVVQFEEIWAVQHQLADGFGVPVIASLHNVDSKARAAEEAGKGVAERARHRYRISRIAAVEARAVRTASLTVAVSESDRQHFERAGAKRVMLVPNGVDEALLDIDWAPGAGADVLFFGQLSYRPNTEGITRFIHLGWPRVRERAPEATLRVVGPNAGRELARVVDQTDGVELVGLVPELAPELASARVVIAPIRFGGGTRIKVLEAMAAARPVVGTGLGVEEIGFVDGRHGLIRETDAALADAVVELLHDPARAQRLGAAARALAQGFGWSRVSAPLEAYYAETAEWRRSRSTRTT
jgi:glycosyltransferase involved in cell wall biosynthesis